MCKPVTKECFASSLIIHNSKKYDFYNKRKALFVKVRKKIKRKKVLTRLNDGKAAPAMKNLQETTDIDENLVV